MGMTNTWDSRSRWKSNDKHVHIEEEALQQKHSTKAGCHLYRLILRANLSSLFIFFTTSRFVGKRTGHIGKNKCCVECTELDSWPRNWGFWRTLISEKSWNVSQPFYTLRTYRHRRNAWTPPLDETFGSAKCWKVNSRSKEHYDGSIAACSGGLRWCRFRQHGWERY